jgi:hypothetical protein
VKGTIIIILDFCHSGGFIEDLRCHGRMIITACKADESTYQVGNLSSGIFGYFFNVSLQRYSKTLEVAFLFTYLSVVVYSKELSEQYEKDYLVHPQMFDGTIRPVRLITYFSGSKVNMMSLFTLKPQRESIWRMSETIGES